MTVGGCSLLCSVTGNRYVPSGVSWAMAAGADDCWRVPELFRNGTWMVTEMHNAKVNAGLTAAHQFIFYMLIRKVISSDFTRLFKVYFKKIAKEQGSEDIRA